MNDTTTTTTMNLSSTTTSSTNTSFQWTAATIVLSIFLFCLAGVAEIVGGWMVWMTLRGNNNSHNKTNVSDNDNQNENDKDNYNKKPWWFAVLGSLILIAYGFIPCFQPTDNFGRIYAAYGGFFIVLSFLFGWALDGNKPDLGDVIGGCIALAGVCVVLFYPR